MMHRFVEESAWTQSVIRKKVMEIMEIERQWISVFLEMVSAKMAELGVWRLL